ncbi:unnamed protein product [Closterium sp. Naga37s-1]|nr:unnamed protein product [Closterium sp. Naga37s-1]
MAVPAENGTAAAPQRPAIHNRDHVVVQDIDDDYDFSDDDTNSSDDDSDALSTASSEDLTIEIESLKRDAASKVFAPSADEASAAPASEASVAPAGAPGADGVATGGETSAAPGGGMFGGLRKKRVRRQILTGVNGEARSGEVTAIMGASGGGKTTLLNILAQRISSGRRKGTVELDGEEVSAGMMRRVSAYVMQDDVLFASLTVRETLMYAAELRLEPRFPRREKEDKVARLIDLLGLAKVAETLIGGEKKSHHIVSFVSSTSYFS